MIPTLLNDHWLQIIFCLIGAPGALLLSWRRVLLSFVEQRLIEYGGKTKVTKKVIGQDNFQTISKRTLAPISWKRRWEKNYRFERFAWYLKSGRGRLSNGCRWLFIYKVWSSNCGGTPFWRLKRTENLQCCCVYCVRKNDTRVLLRKSWRAHLENKSGLYVLKKFWKKCFM